MGRRKTAPEPLHGQQHRAAPLHSHHRPSGPLLPTKRCPETSLHPTNLQEHEESGTGCELGQVGSHGWLSQLSKSGAQLEQLCQLSPHCAMPNSRQNPSTKPPLPECYVWSKVWGSQACPLSLCQGCWARLASFFPRPKWQRLPFLCMLILSPLSVSIKAQPGWRNTRKGRAASTDMAHTSGTPCPLLTAPAQGGGGHWGWWHGDHEERVAMVQPVL